MGNFGANVIGFSDCPFIDTRSVWFLISLILFTLQLTSACFAGEFLILLFRQCLQTRSTETENFDFLGLLKVL